MRCKLANTAQGNRDYQREMAAALITSEGLDAAMLTCLNNGWEGETQRAARAAERRQHSGAPVRGPGPDTSRARRDRGRRTAAHLRRAGSADPAPRRSTRHARGRARLSRGLPHGEPPRISRISGIAQWQSLSVAYENMLKAPTTDADVATGGSSHRSLMSATKRLNASICGSGLDSTPSSIAAT